MPDISRRLRKLPDAFIDLTLEEDTVVKNEPIHQTVTYIHREIRELGVTGKVCWYNSRYCYGFITRDDNKTNIFVHRSAIIKTNPHLYMASLCNGEQVRFDVVYGRKGKREAANVTGPNGGCVLGECAFGRRSRYSYEYSSNDSYEYLSDTDMNYNSEGSASDYKNYPRKRHNFLEKGIAKRARFLKEVYNIDRNFDSVKRRERKNKDEIIVVSDECTDENNNNEVIVISDSERDNSLRKKVSNKRKGHSYCKNLRSKKMKYQNKFGDRSDLDEYIEI